VDGLSKDFRTAGTLRPQDRVMLEYAAKLAREPGAMSQEDVVRLRDAGFTERAVLEIALAAAYMSFVNRLAQGLGVEVERHFDQFAR